MKRRIAALLLAIGLTLCGCTSNAEEVWMYAVSAGKADAILLGVDDAVCLIDTGYARSRGKILAAMERMGVERLDAVFVTHTDSDHVEGLDWLAQSDIEIGAWYASAMYTGIKKEEKHPAVKAAKTRGEEVQWLQAGDSVSLGDAILNVLSPIALSTDKDNDNSLVLMLQSTEGNILLMGDAELPAEQMLLESGVSLKCDVLKVANHADDDTTGAAFVLAASPQAAVISTSSEEKPETPDPRAVALLESVGAQVAVTQDCTGGVLVRLTNRVASVEFIDLPEPIETVVVKDVLAEDDLITLYNSGAEAQSLNGWYLYSDRGGELFVFPEETVIGAGQYLTIGSNSTEQSVDLRWNDKKVVHKSKTDVIALYDENGMLVSSHSNGF